MPDDLKFPKFDPDLVKAIIGNMSIFPDAAYWKKFGIEQDEKGYVTAPNGWRIPTAETCVCQDIEKATEVDELEKLLTLGEPSQDASAASPLPPASSID